MKSRGFKFRTGAIIISFIVGLACIGSGCGSNDKSLNETPPKTIVDSNKVKPVQPKDNKNNIKPAQPDIGSDNQTASESSLKKSILGAWELIEVTQNGKTEKADPNKKLLPEENLIYVFSQNSMDIYLLGKKVSIPYSWIGGDIIQGTAAGVDNEKQEKIKMKVKIKDNKLYISVIDNKNKKGELVFQKYTGQLPIIKSN